MSSARQTVGTRHRRAPRQRRPRSEHLFIFDRRVMARQERRGRPLSCPKASSQPSASTALGFSSWGRSGAELRAQEDVVTRDLRAQTLTDLSNLSMSEHEHTSTQAD